MANPTYEGRANDAASEASAAQFSIDRTHPGRWTITFKSSSDLFFPLLALPGAQARRAKVRDMGYGVRSDFELNFGRYLPSFGRADDGATGQER